MDAQTHSPPVRARFVGDPDEFRSLATRGSALQLPTFGFYRFWLTTDVRRHLWSNTIIGNDALEYTGRARDLLIGFLIALVVLSPTYVLVFWLQIEAERMAGAQEVPVYLFAGLALNGVVLYVLGYYGVYRARRYRATRTVLRGVRFLMSGSGWSYVRRALFWDVLTLLTLGLAMPWRNAALERYKMDNTFYGDLQGSFDGKGSTLFRRGWWLWAMSVGVYVLIAAMQGLAAIGSVPQETVSLVTGLGAISLFFVLVFGVPLYTAIDMRWRLEGLRFGAVHLDSDLSKGAVLWRYVKSGLLTSLFVVAAALVGGAVAFLISQVFGPSEVAPPDLQNFASPPIASVIVIIATYAVMIVGLSAIQLQVFTRGLWRLAAESVTVHGVDALDAVSARGADADGFGEGLADALDFGGAGV